LKAKPWGKGIRETGRGEKHAGSDPGGPIPEQREYDVDRHVTRNACIIFPQFGEKERSKSLEGGRGGGEAGGRENCPKNRIGSNIDAIRRCKKTPVWGKKGRMIRKTTLKMIHRFRADGDPHRQVSCTPVREMMARFLGKGKRA